MKKIALLSLMTLVFIGDLVSQAPNLMSYQAVIWDANGNLVSEKTVSIKISILQGSVTGTSVYSETHRLQTNINGLVSLMIGGGTNPTGKIADINWGAGSYFLKTETDPTGGVNFSITGTTQLVSVPYSMFSGVAGNISTKNTGLPGQTLTIDKDGKLIWVGTNIPTVVTGGVTSITQTDSKVSGIVTSDGGSTITIRGFVWSINPNPTISLSTKTSDGTGVGTYSSNINGLIPNTKYFIRAYASNSAGTGYGDVVEFVTSISNVTMGVPCPGTPTVKDIDDNTYNTVQIGTQCWMRENLKTSKYSNGDIISNILLGRRDSIKGAWSHYNDDSYHEKLFGKLYNWYAANDYRKICPKGWHLPSANEWQILRNFLGENPGTKLKEKGNEAWKPRWEDSPDNSSNFSAYGAGQHYDYYFAEFKDAAYFWSSSTYDDLNSFARFLSSNSNEFPSTVRGKGNQFSIRCLKDTFTIVSIPILSTTVITSITAISATSGGNITSDGGASITTRGVVWSTSPTPTISLSTKTTVGTGIGSFTSSIANLTPNTKYYVRAYATNSAGTGYGNEISFTTKSDSTSVMGIPCPGTPTVKDIDGNTYNTVQIGTQCWTKENLKVTKYNDGTTIPLDTSGGTSGNGIGQTWGSRSNGARTIYANDNTNLATYGYLYNWYAVKGIVTEGSLSYKNLCPSGWHIPTDNEWETLTNYLGGSKVAGGKMKTTGTTFWNSPNTGATNESGFSALPGGFRYIDGRFNDIRLIAFFWSATEIYSNNAWYRYLYNQNGYVYRDYANGKTVGDSVRCLRD